MNRAAVLSLVAVVAFATILGAAEERSAPPPGQWLNQLVGDWESHSEVIVDPSQPPLKYTGSDSTRSIGEWTVSEIKTGTPAGFPMTGLLTIGYDAEKKKFVGTWIDSMSTHLWTYEGTLDENRTVLTLNTVGPSMMAPGKTAKFRERIEIKSKDHRVFTSSMQGDDGEWMTFVTVNAKRKK